MCCSACESKASNSLSDLLVSLREGTWGVLKGQVPEKRRSVSHPLFYRNLKLLDEQSKLWRIYGKKALHTVPEHKVDMIGDDLTLFKAKAFFLFIEVVAYNLIECRQLLFEEKDALLCHRL